MTARRIKKTDEPQRRKKLLDALRKGMPIKAAAAAAGMHYMTVWRSRQADKELDDEIVVAECDGEAKLYGFVFAASKENWKAAAWLLERIRSSTFGRRDANAVSPEQLAALLNQIGLGLLTAIPAEHHAAIQVALQTAMGAIVKGETNEDGGGDEKL